MKQPAESIGPQVSSEEIKAVIVGCGGINAGARLLGLKPGTVRQRCKRESWMDDPKFRTALVTTGHKTGKTPAKQNLPATLPAARTPAQAIVAEMQDLGSKSRINMARGLADVAEHVAGRDAFLNLADASNVKQTVQSLALVHGWQNQPAAAPGLRLTVTANVMPEPVPMSIEAEWSEVPPTTIDARAGSLL